MNALIDTAAAAERLGVSERSVRRMVFEKTLAYVKVGGSVRFDPADVDRYIRANRIEAQR